MTNKKFGWRMLVMALVLGMTVVGCDSGGGGDGSKSTSTTSIGNNDAGEYAGTWTGTKDGKTLHIVNNNLWC